MEHVYPVAGHLSRGLSCLHYDIYGLMSQGDGWQHNKDSHHRKSKPSAANDHSVYTRCKKKFPDMDHPRPGMLPLSKTAATC